MDTQLDTIALLYLAFAHATDGSLSGEEMRTVAQRLREWRPDASLDQVGGTIKSAVERYKALGDQDKRLAEARRCVATLATSLTPDERQRVLVDLRALADADGTVTDSENSFLSEVEQAFGATA